ncbi:fibulin-7 isoform X2 [Oryzias melastigma]|uniref:fibulin-7 isoform X2 n=1 Tax=Oryzias melastigma TaxID=30732 RepID=UPI00168CB9E1|nr:fibulin-7 isoform X2 [Oryzias melastigma]
MEAAGGGAGLAVCVCVYENLNRSPQKDPEICEKRSWQSRYRTEESVRMEYLLSCRRTAFIILMMVLHQVTLSTAQLDCPSTHDLLNSLRQVEKMLVVHETSYRHGLRALRKKISALHNSTMAIFNSASCPKPEAPLYGRRLGRVFGIGHEVHFVCKADYELIGPRTRVCLESLKWSGQQPMCRRLNSSSSSMASFSSAVLSASSLPTHSAASATAPPPTSVRPSDCTHFLGSTRCTCDVGFTISGRDNNVCTGEEDSSSVIRAPQFVSLEVHMTRSCQQTSALVCVSDIDECSLFPPGQSGRFCVHQCVNTPGSFHCVCPAGYSLARDARSCSDIDECENGMHNCPAEQMCVNTFGGFQCVTVECPHMKNATYIKTSPMRCERNPCMVEDAACVQAPNSITFHFLAVVSNLSAPRDLFRVSAARVLGDTLRFGLVGGHGRGHFSVQRTGRQTGTLLLVRSIKGPATLDAEVEMSELQQGNLLGRFVTKVSLFVSAYDF